MYLHPRAFLAYLYVGALARKVPVDARVTRERAWKRMLWKTRAEGQVVRTKMLEAFPLSTIHRNALKNALLLPQNATGDTPAAAP